MNCPLCNKKFTQDPRDEGMSIDKCSEIVKFEYGKPLPHYSIDHDIGMETMVVYPFKIVTHFRTRRGEDVSTSRIYKYHTPKNPSNPKSLRFKGLITIPKIHPDTSEKLLNRIKGLLLFL
jgi:hypothetical protein